MITDTKTAFGETVIRTEDGRYAGTIHQGAYDAWFASPRGSTVQAIPCRDREDAHQTVLRLARNIYGEVLVG